MNVEIINTGSELMLGHVLNTHHQWLARQLSALGHTVIRQVSVPDTAPEIQHAVREALSRADLVITTGGLGPTSDDLTRDWIAELLGRRLVLDDGVLKAVEEFFTVRKRPMPERARVQAMVPEGAKVLGNANGTAPGLIVEVPANGTGDPRCSRWLIMLPGPPRELRPMFTAHLLPWLRETFPPREAFVCRTLRTTGMGESLVEANIAPVLQAFRDAGVEIGYCAHVGTVDVRFVGRGERGQQLVAGAEQAVRETLGGHVFGIEEDSLEVVVVKLLAGRHQTLVLAESCTGGLIAHRITNVPGASEIFMAGLVTYSNQAKQDLLGVREETLRVHGAVSEATAREMAEGARLRHKTDYAMAVTGIAGPDGGSPAKPVGTAFIALAAPGKTLAGHFMNPYDRETFKLVTSQQALDLLRLELLGSCQPGQ